MTISSEVEYRQSEIDAIYADCFPDDEPGASSYSVETDISEWTQGDKNLCSKITDSKQSEKFKRLFAGDISGYQLEDGNPDHSAADMALLSILGFWTKKNPAQMLRIWAASALANRDKWRNRPDYRERSIKAAIVGTKETYQEHRSTPADDFAGNDQEFVDPAQLLGGYEVTEDYVGSLGNEKFLFKNLIIRQHIVVIIAVSGGGKTALLFFHVARKLAEQGLTVWYVDADSPASDHKMMKRFADKHRIKFLIPDVNQGKSVQSFIDDMRKLANSHADLNGYVFILDTLKKFIDLMSKKSAKEFFVLMRKLTKLGATVVLPGHANKHRDSDGNLVFEGVGDVKSDADELIFFEKVKKPDGSLDVTTVIDTDLGAKVRGLFRPFSFHIDTDRNITIYDKPLELIDLSNTGVPKATDEEILTTAEEYLKSRAEPVGQAQLAEYTSDKVNGEAGKKRVRKVIVQHSVMEGDTASSGDRFIYTVGERNAHYYSLPKPLPSPQGLFR